MQEAENKYMHGPSGIVLCHGPPHATRPDMLMTESLYGVRSCAASTVREARYVGNTDWRSTTIKGVGELQTPHQI
jgi:hypothetical protein